MPVKSKAQWAKLAVLRRQGKLSTKKFHEWVRGVNFKKLPKHVRKHGVSEHVGKVAQSLGRLAAIRRKK